MFPNVCVDFVWFVLVSYCLLLAVSCRAITAFIYLKIQHLSVFSTPFFGRKKEEVMCAMCQPTGCRRPIELILFILVSHLGFLSGVVCLHRLQTASEIVSVRLYDKSFNILRMYCITTNLGKCRHSILFMHSFWLTLVVTRFGCCWWWL